MYSTWLIVRLLRFKYSISLRCQMKLFPRYIFLLTKTFGPLKHQYSKPLSFTRHMKVSNLFSKHTTGYVFLISVKIFKLIYGDALYSLVIFSQYFESIHNFPQKFAEPYLTSMHVDVVSVYFSLVLLCSPQCISVIFHCLPSHQWLWGCCLGAMPWPIYAVSYAIRVMKLWLGSSLTGSFPHGIVKQQLHNCLKHSSIICVSD